MTRPWPLLRLALLAFLVLPLATGAAAPQAGVEVPQTLTLDDVLQKARGAAHREAWAELEHGLALKGESDLGGVEAHFELSHTEDGRYRLSLDGRLARVQTFDGQVAAERVREGPSRELVLEDREALHYAQWLHSGFWLAPSSPLEIELVEATGEDVVLHLSFPGSPTFSRLTLDPVTWLPREMSRRSGGSESVLRFRDYQPVQGVPIAHLVESSVEGHESRLRVLESGAASASEYAQDASPAGDTDFDPEVPPGVEFRRIRTGHLLVHPLVEDEDVGWFILDSGAGKVCIDPTVADSLGMERFGSVPAVGVAGTVAASYRQGGSLTLGPITIYEPVYIELDLSFLEQMWGVEVAGICGYELFARAVLDLDLEAETLSIFDPQDFDLGEGEWSELVLDGRMPCVPCRFEGDRSGLFRIDLGDSSTVCFYTPAVQALGLLEGREVQPAQVGGVGGAGKASTGILEWFELGGRRVENLQTMFSQTEVGAFTNPYSLGNLGCRMLEPFRVVFDYSHSRIALVPRS